MGPRARCGWAVLGAGALALALAACGTEDALGPDGSGAAAGTGGAGAGTTTGPGGAGGGGGPAAAHLVLPSVVDLPYVLAGAGGSEASFAVVNDGSLDVAGLTWSLTGSAELDLAGALPDALAAGQSAPVTIVFAGAASEHIAEATLHLEAADGESLAVPVFAVAGDPGLGSGAWQDVTLPGGVPCGAGVTVSMPAAPYPYGGSSFTDDSVRVFVPEGHRTGAAEDLVIHFHGHSTTLAGTLAGHLYERHLCASGANALLVVPQGPYETASGDFGKLMDPGGLEALVEQVLVLLYREGRVTHPRVADLALTSHSGGYWAVANNLDPSVNALPVRQVDLFDSLYGFEATYVGWAEAGGLWRSNYTAGGGTLDNNQTAASTLVGDGFPVATEPTLQSLRDDPILVYFADTTHGGATRLDGAYGEQLRFAARHHRRGPRIELREAVAAGGTAHVRWLAPFDADTVGYRVETASPGGAFVLRAEVGAAASEASFPFTSAARVRVVPVVVGLAPEEVFASDVYRLDADASVLVVDGFDRVLDGSFGGLAHDFAALVGEAAGGAATASNEAVTEDGLDLSAWPVVVWLVGDESTSDRPLTTAEEDALGAYLAGGGRLVVSGSELGYVLGPTAAGASFLAATFGASYAADDAQSYAVSGTGALAGLGPFGYAGPGAPYPEDYPDAWAPTGAGESVLLYDNGQAAAVGIAGQAVVVGFPLELVDDAAARAALVAE
ncbi:MAG: hypothetical protein HY908_25685, partial [Myxococcales bacterium]|nr:hypothetical protein [Myxococcales bacterium]